MRKLSSRYLPIIVFNVILISFLSCNNNLSSDSSSDKANTNNGTVTTGTSESNNTSSSKFGLLSYLKYLSTDLSNAKGLSIQKESISTQKVDYSCAPKHIAVEENKVFYDKNNEDNDDDNSNSSNDSN